MLEYQVPPSNQPVVETNIKHIIAKVPALEVNLDVPTVEHFMKMGAWIAGTPDDLIAHLKSFEERYPGMEYANLSTPISTPQSVMLEQFQWVAEEVMPAFGSARR